jgi:hypothetical protein
MTPTAAGPNRLTVNVIRDSGKFLHKTEQPQMAVGRRPKIHTS